MPMAPEYVSHERLRSCIFLDFPQLKISGRKNRKSNDRIDAGEDLVEPMALQTVLRNARGKRGLQEKKQRQCGEAA